MNPPYLKFNYLDNSYLTYTQLLADKATIKYKHMEGKCSPRKRVLAGKDFWDSRISPTRVSENTSNSRMCGNCVGEIEHVCESFKVMTDLNIGRIPPPGFGYLNLNSDSLFCIRSKYISQCKKFQPNLDEEHDFVHLARFMVSLMKPESFGGQRVTGTTFDGKAVMNSDILYVPFCEAVKLAKHEGAFLMTDDLEHVFFWNGGSYVKGTDRLRTLGRNVIFVAAKNMRKQHLGVPAFEDLSSTFMAKLFLEEEENRTENCVRKEWKRRYPNQGPNHFRFLSRREKSKLAMFAAARTGQFVPEVFDGMKEDIKHVKASVQEAMKGVKEVTDKVSPSADKLMTLINSLQSKITDWTPEAVTKVIRDLHFQATVKATFGMEISPNFWFTLGLDLCNMFVHRFSVSSVLHCLVSTIGNIIISMISSDVSLMKLLPHLSMESLSDMAQHISQEAALNADIVALLEDDLTTAKELDQVVGQKKAEAGEALAAGLFSIVGSLASFIFLGSVNDKSRFEFIKRVKDMNALGQARNHVKSTIADLGNILSQAVNYFSEQWARRKLQQANPKLAERVMKWTEELTEACSDIGRERILVDATYKMTVLNLLPTARQFINEAELSKVSKKEADAVRKWVALLLKQAQDINAYAQRIKDESAVRFDPFCFSVFGDPGIGKSALAMIIVNMLADTYEVPIPEELRLYSRNCADKQWNGYGNHFAALFDDVCQFRDNTEACETELREFIAAKSNFRYYPVFAELFDKGRSFTSKVIACTTNTPYPKRVSVESIGAIWRRRDVLIQASVIGNRQPGSFDHLAFCILDPEDNHSPQNILAHSLNIHEMVTYVYEKWQDHIVAQKKVMESLLPGHRLKYNPTTKRMEPVDEPLIVVDNIAATLLPKKVAEGGGDEDVDLGTCSYFTARDEDFNVKLTPREKEILDALNINLEEVNVQNCEGSVLVYDKQTSKLDSYKTGFLKYMGIGYSQVMAYIDRTVRKLPEFIVDCFKTFMHYVNKGRRTLADWIRKIANTKLVKILGIISLVSGALAAFNAVQRIRHNDMPSLQEKIASKALYEKSHLGMLGRATGKLVAKLTGGDYVENKDFYEYNGVEGNYLIDKKTFETTKLDSKADWSSESNDKDQRNWHNKPKFIVKKRGRGGKKWRAESSQNVEDLVEYRLQHALIELRYQPEGRGVRFLQGICIGGTDVLCPKHFFVNISDGDTVKFVKNGIEREFRFKENNLMVVEGEDIALYRVGMDMEPCKDIISRFISEKEAERIVKASSFTLIPRGTNFFRDVTVVYPIEDANEYGDYSYYGETFNVIRGWMYMADTAVGDCGSPLVSLNPQHVNPILGFHAAAVDTSSGHKIGFAPVTTMECVRSLKEELDKETKLPTVIPASVPEVVGDEVKGKLYPEGSFTIVGTIPKNVEMADARKSDIQKTVIFDQVYVHMTEQSVLVPSDSRLTIPGTSPLRLGINKYGGYSPHSKFAIDDITRYLSMKCVQWFQPNFKPTWLTLDEAINGTEEKYVDGLNYSASPGWPYKTFAPPGVKGKEWLFTSVVTGARIRRYVDNPYLMDTIIKRIQKGRKGRRIFSVWKDTLKSELRPIEKIKAGKTRVFTIAPVDYTILCHMAFMPYVAAFYSGKIVTFSGVGINTQSAEWTQLYNKMCKFAHHIVGDFGTYDGNMAAVYMESFMVSVLDWFDKYESKQLMEVGIDGVEALTFEERQLIRAVLLNEMVHTFQVVTNVVYMSHHGNPSGNPMTVVVNTYVNTLIMRMAFRELARRQALTKFIPLVAYDKNVQEIMYGDDNWLSVSDEASEFFNQYFVTEILAEVGIEYTTAKKEKVSKDFRVPINEVSFLKQKFRKHPLYDVYLAPIDRITIQELTNWIKISEDSLEAMYTNLYISLEMAYHHGKKYYDNHLERINQALEKLWLPRVYGTFEEREEVFCREVFSEPKTVCWKDRRADMLVRLKHFKENLCDIDIGTISLPEWKPEAGVRRGEVLSSRCKIMENDNKEITKYGNWTFAEARETKISNLAITETMKVNALNARYCIDEPPWDPRLLLSKPILLARTSWGEAATGRLFKCLLPSELDKIIHGSHPAVRFVNTFALVRLDMKIKAQLNSTQFHQGRIIVAFVPGTWGDNSYTALQTTDYYNVGFTGFPHINLDASESSNGELIIPYNYYQPMMEGFSGGFQGSLVVAVINPLQAAVGTSNQVELTLWISFGDDSFVKYPVGFRPEAGEKDMVKKSMKVVDAVVKGDIEGALSGVLQNVLDLSKLDYPLAMKMPCSILPKPVDNQSHGMGVTDAYRMSLDPECQVPVSAMANSTKRETSVDLIKSIPMICNIWNLSTNDDQGKEIGRIYVNPIQAQVEPWGDPTEGNYVVQPTYLSMLAENAYYWRGGITFRFDIIATRFHTGKLAVVFMPGSKSYQQDTIDLSAYGGMTIDIQESSTFTMTVPFVSPTMWKLTHSWADLTDYKYHPLSDTGSLSMIVINELKNPNNVAGNVQINVYVSGAEDFQIAIPRYGSFVGYPVPKAKDAKYLTVGRNIVDRKRAEAGEITEEAAEEERFVGPISEEETGRAQVSESVVLKGGSESKKLPPFICMGEEIVDIMDVLRRKQFYTHLDWKVSALKNKRIKYVFAVNPWVPFWNIDHPGAEFIIYSRCDSMLDHYARMFTYWRGSMRYQFVVNCPPGTVAPTLELSYEPQSNYLDGTKFNGGVQYREENLDWRHVQRLSNCAHQRWCSAVAPAIEVEVPFNSQNSQLYLWPFDYSQKSCNGILSLTLTVHDIAQGDFSVDVFRSAGDDTTFSVMRPSPIIIYGNSVD